MYTYYAKLEAEEHMMFAKEIAMTFGILTKNDKPNSLLVGKILHQYIESVDAIRLYYFSSQVKNLLEVYPASVYMPAIRAFAAKVKSLEGTYFIDGKNYYYRIVNEPAKLAGTSCDMIIVDDPLGA